VLTRQAGKQIAMVVRPVTSAAEGAQDPGDTAGDG
jgi:hypothetical protein